MREEQAALLAAGEPFFSLKYVAGSKGWVGVHLSAPLLEWEEVGELVSGSSSTYRTQGSLARHVE